VGLSEIAAHTQGFNVRTLFTATSKKTDGRPQGDYLVAMHGHPGKPEVAADQGVDIMTTLELRDATSSLRRVDDEDKLVVRQVRYSAFSAGYLG